MQTEVAVGMHFYAQNGSKPIKKNWNETLSAMIFEN